MMAFLTLSFMGLISVCYHRNTVFCVSGISRGEPGNFPINGCYTDEIDFLFLYYVSSLIEKQLDQEKVAFNFAEDLKDSNETSQRLLFAGVYDSFSTSNDKVNISSLGFNTSIVYPQSEEGEQGSEVMYYNNVNKTIELKVQLVNRLFSEMAEVRENVTHIAIIFLDGFHLSLEETRSVPHIVQQQVTDIKIFVVVHDVRYVERIVHLRDTLLRGTVFEFISRQIVVMAICNQCLEGWFSLHRSDHTVSMSCYFLLNYKANLTSTDAAYKCGSHDSSLAAIETKVELNFVQTHLSAILNDKYLRFDSDQIFPVSTQLYIGLRKDLARFGERFYWKPAWDSLPLPLLFTHWLPGKPSGGYNIGCGVWRFVWNVTRNDVTNLPSVDGHFVDGWEDVGCDDTLTPLNLCEVVLPLRVEDMNMMRVQPASNESFSKALTKGDFRIYRDNIVSVSANIASRDFVEFLKQTEKEILPLFDCGIGIPDPRYISYIYVCDSIDHCSNRRDEMRCSYRLQDTNKDSNFARKCHGVYCCDRSCLPLQRVGDGEVDCNVCEYNIVTEVNDESEVVVRYSRRNKNCALFCRDGDECVHFSQLNDSKTDCSGPDGPLDETIGKLETADTCYNILGHRIWAPRCVYVRDRFGVVVGCRDMSHLEDCENFECPEGYFKCLNTYCIPQHYVLDGTVDCPAGEEENNYTIGSCTGNFACWNSKMCLHPDLVCNGHPDCPHQDDEIDCDVKCHKLLRCKSGTVTIPNHDNSILIQFDIFEDGIIDDRSRYLDLSRAGLIEFFSIMYLENIVVMICSHCNITFLDVNFFEMTTRLQELDLSYNQIRNINGLEIYLFALENIRLLNLSYNKEFDKIIYWQLKFLETVDLSHTSVSQLGESFLVGLPSLKHLDLSFTKISNLKKETFQTRYILLTLDLRGLPLKDFYENFFNDLTISQDLFTDSFELCCPQIRGANIPSYTCHAPDDAISSCFNLVGVQVQRVLLWVVAVLAVLGNMTVIAYRVMWERSILRTGYGLFVTNLGISDFIMGVYLFIISGADYYYRDIYVLNDKSWRESIVCRFAGFLATLSIETSTFFVFLITLDRFLVMKFPFGHKTLNKVTKVTILLFSWIIGFLLALTPALFRFEIYSSNAMCLGLHLTTKRLNGWEFSFGVFIVLNFCLFLLIVYGQRAIFSAMSENRMAQVASRRAEDITVAKQLSLVALSNFLCWFPVGLMGVLSLGGYVISHDVYAWTTVIVLPINSAANPLLYTIPALMSKWERFKYGTKRST